MRNATNTIAVFLALGLIVLGGTLIWSGSDPQAISHLETRGGGAVMLTGSLLFLFISHRERRLVKAASNMN